MENKLTTTYAMNEWGFIGQDNFVGIGKSATSFKFKSRPGRAGVAMCDTKG
jgi:hypothetical protein